MTTLKVAQVIRDTVSEGPGRRFAVWVQGCPLRCPGCCNPQMQAFHAGGRMMEIDEIVADLLRAKDECELEGLSLVGGEPFYQASGCAELAERAQDAGLSVVTFTGYLYEKLKQRHYGRVSVGRSRLLAATDVLIDGPYQQDLPETRRRWVGSSNQRVHHLTPCYLGDPRFLEPNTLEVRLENGVLTVNGWPGFEVGA